MIIWWLKLGDLPPGHDALLFSIRGTGSFFLYMPSRTDTAGHTYARPLYTQSKVIR